MNCCLYSDDGCRVHYCELTLCAMATHPSFCCCHTVIMCCGAEGSGWEPEFRWQTVPFSVMVYVTTMVDPFNSVLQIANCIVFQLPIRGIVQSWRSRSSVPSGVTPA